MPLRPRTSSFAPRERRLRPLLFVLCVLLGPAAAVAEPLFYWVPATVPVDALDQSRTTLFYEGDSGRLVSAQPDAAEALSALGGTRVDVRESHDLYIYVLEDGARAEFELPAEVLVRAEHEVLLAMPKATGATPDDETRGDRIPRLTDAAAEALDGFKELVYVPLSPIAWPQSGSSLRNPTPPYDPVIADMIDQVTSATYLAVWQPLEDFVTRYTFAVPNNDDAANWIHDQFAAMGYGTVQGMDLAFHQYSQSGEIRRNVVATLHGDSPEVVYITGHFDATSPTPEICAPGADDNASGAVAVLEAARVMSLAPGGFTRTLKFVAFNGEEQGLRGSRAYVAAVAAQGEEIAGVYNADMIAYRGEDPAPPDSWMFINAQSSFLADIFVDAVGLYLPGLLEPIIGGALVTASDHSSIWNYGYPAILVIESRLYGGELSPWYHTCNDLIANYVGEIDFAVHNTQAIIASAAIVARDYDPLTAAAIQEELGQLSLRAPYPSPMQDEATISFVLPSAQSVKLELYDVRGHKVRTLVQASRDRGVHDVRWNGRDDSGNLVASGVYFARLQLPEAGVEFTKKLTLVR